ncbi:alpha/beta hydrolase-fold protein (plasmid) [Thioclava litoralis]|uniref:Alpha/beta hydrolase-fold protein n=1 Tax=Thioclava litoralis TaxID=3076557 RepID=A0ABZ1E7B3_9RHOB|nr:alpha/beta hydrolase-fold protein [Thioclava sp. FTW29]
MIAALRGMVMAMAIWGGAGPRAMAQDHGTRGTPLPQGETVTATLEAVPAHYVLAAPAGSYVEGIFAPETAAQELVLRLRQGGQPVRQLVAAVSGQQRFRFLQPEAGALQVSGAQGGAYSLTLTRIVPPAQQHPPAPEWPSPIMGQIASQSGALERLWPQIVARGTPLVEETGAGLVVTFLYRGAQRNVRLLGGPSNDHDWLERLGGTDLFYKSYRVARDTRLSYQLAVDVPDIPGPAQARRAALLAVAQADPLNPHRLAPAADAYMAYSVFDGPEAPAQAGFPAQALALEWQVFGSGHLGNRRAIALYTTPDFTPQDPRAVLAVVLDGTEAAKGMHLPDALRQLAAAHRLPPMAVVFVDPIDAARRAAEMPQDPAFAAMLADELVPRIAAQIGLRPDPARTVLVGESFGGLAALRVALERPDRFGAVIALSGSYWWAPEPRGRAASSWITQRLLQAPQMPRVFLGAGLSETARGGDALAGDIWESNRQVASVLAARGGEVLWSPWSGGHDRYVWRGKITEGLIALFGLTG